LNSVMLRWPMAWQKRRKLPGSLGDGHRQQGLALLADLGALGHVAQAVEIDVGAAVDGHQAGIADAGALHVFLDAGDGQRPGRFRRWSGCRRRCP
jgi:hypothetical protein